MRSFSSSNRISKDALDGLERCSMFQGWSKYESPERWASYYTQIDQLRMFSPQSCLEVGVGNGIVTEGLRHQGIQADTLDVDATLHPTIVGSVDQIPSKSEAYDVVLCAEVLEHLPFDRCEQALRECMRVARLGAVVSLPHWGYTLRCIADIPGLPPFRFAWKLPIAISHPPGGEHYWEIGKRGYPLSRILALCATVGDVEDHFLLPWMPYHHFFRIRKRP